jgi:hypothetical protein
MPGFLVRLLRAIPLVGRSDLVRGLDDARLRWSPASVRFSSGFTSSHADLETFRVPIATASDTLATLVRNVAAAFRNRASVELRPLRSTSFGMDYASTRDLKDYGDTTAMGILTHQAGRRVGGLNLGFERDRTVGTHFTWTPTLFSWLRPRFTTTSTFSLTRDPNGATPERTVGDTAGMFRLPTAFTNARSTDLGASVDFSRLLRVVFGDTAHIVKLLDRLSPLDVSTRTDRRSQFDRPGFDPALGYQLGLGSVEAFRTRGGRLATYASDSRQTRLASGLRLPLGFSMVAAYSVGRQQGWVQRGDGQAESREDDTQWPDLTGRWMWSPAGGFFKQVLSSVTASAAVQVRQAATVQPPLELGIGAATSAANEIRGLQESRSYPLSLAITWVERVTTSLSWSSSSILDENAGNVMRTDRQDAAAALMFTFRPPQNLLPLPSDVRTALRYAQSTDEGCLTLAGGEACVPISSASRRQLNFSMDTDMPPNLSAGISVGYILTEDAHVNRKFAQLVVTAAVTVNFQAGTPR